MDKQNVYNLFGIIGISYICVLVFMLIFQIGTACDAYVIGWDHVVTAVICFGFPFVAGYLFGLGKR